MKNFAYEYLGDNSEQHIKDVIVQDDLDEEDFHNVPNSELNHSIEILNL